MLGFFVGEAAHAAVRALLFIGLMGMVGAALFARRVAGALDRDAQSVALDGAMIVLRLAAALVSVVIAVRLVQQAAAFADTPDAWRSAVSLVLTQTTWGIGWFLQALALPCVLLAAPRAVRSGGAMQVALGVALVALCASPAFSGHAVGAPRLALVAIALDTVHVLAAGAWLGTLGTVAVVALPIARDTGGVTMTRVLARFSPIALASAFALAATGVFASWLHLETLAALWTSDYGLMLVRKLVLLAGVAAVGAYNWKVVTPRLAATGDLAALRRSTLIELTLALALIAVTSVLVATPLPAEM